MSKPCVGIIKSYDPRPSRCDGQIWMEGNRRRLRFNVADLEDIAEPQPGLKVTFIRKKDRALAVRLWKPKEQQPKDADGGLPAA